MLHPGLARELGGQTPDQPDPLCGLGSSRSNRSFRSFWALVAMETVSWSLRDAPSRDPAPSSVL